MLNILQLFSYEMYATLYGIFLMLEDERMEIQQRVKSYLEYCEFRKQLDGKTLKAYRIDLR